MPRITESRTVGEALHLLRFRAERMGRLPRRSRDALAELAGVSGGTVSNYEQDRTRRWDETIRIVQTLAGLVDEDAGSILAELEELDRHHRKRRPAEIEADAVTGRTEATDIDGEEE